MKWTIQSVLTAIDRMCRVRWQQSFCCFYMSEDFINFFWQLYRIIVMQSYLQLMWRAILSIVLYIVIMLSETKCADRNERDSSWRQDVSTATLVSTGFQFGTTLTRRHGEVSFPSNRLNVHFDWYVISFTTRTSETYFFISQFFLHFIYNLINII